MKLRAPATPALKSDTVAILLGGWAALPPDPCESGFTGGMLELFDPNGPATLWRTHEVYLRAVARRWGWTPRHVGPDGVARFFGEHLAAGFRL